MEKNIKVVHVLQNKVGSKWIDESERSVSYIDLKTFRKSFIDERWANERRYNKEYTKYGYFHTQTVVKRDENHRSLRNFIFE